MTSYAPVHNHTHYSALDGLSTPLEIAQRCQCIGCTSAGITDHGTVAGHLEFGRVMRENDIKPIFGCEFYHGVKSEYSKNERDQFHFVAGALTDEGLRNIWRMVDAASDPGNYRYVGRMNWDIVRDHAEGVFATSACIQGLVAQSVLAATKGEVPSYLVGVLDRYLEIYRENFYIEIHTYPGEEHEQLNWGLVGLANERGIPLIYATDAHFAGPEQYKIHDAFVAMQTGESILMDPSERKMWHPKSLYIQDEAQIRASLGYLPAGVVDEALRNSHELAARCNADLPQIERHIPVFVPGDCPWQQTSTEENAAMMMVRLVEAGIEWRYGADASLAVWDKAAYEIEVMLEAHLEHYFLQVWDVCEFCNREKIIRGPGRGSAAGSIISYALGITDVDPIRFGLIFERFWNPGRAKGFPDIDIDFPVAHRKRVREYLMKRWGNDRVRTIGTTMRMKPKAVLDKTQRACGVTWDEKEALKNIISDIPDIDIHGADTIGWSSDTDPGKTIYVEDHVGERILDWWDAQPADRQETLRRWIEIVEVCCGRVSGYGVHPSGVVVSDVPLRDQLPCMYNRSQEVQVTCFPMADVDKRGFLKDDLLGLRNLDTLARWEELRGKVGEDWHALTYEQFPDEMWELLDHGLTMGIFQIEKGYARRLCKDMKPRSIEDLSVIVAINRPGPIRAKVPDSLIRRKHGLEEVTYDHPILEPILANTWGHIVYQEQVMQFFGAIGYNDSDTDEIRKILGKKKPEIMATVRYGEGEWAGKGYTAMAQAAGLDTDTIDLLWQKIEGFASYSFNKAHAICYAVMAFRTLYAKWCDGAKFMIACIQTNPDDAGDYVTETRRRGIVVRPPHIRKSDWDIKDIDGDIYFGFSNVKGIGKGAAKYVVGIRDDYGIYTPEEFQEAHDDNQRLWEQRQEQDDAPVARRRSPKQIFGSNKLGLLEQVGAFDEYVTREMPMAAMQLAERELLGVIITDDCDQILSHHSDQVQECDSYSELDMDITDNDLRVDIPGIVASVNAKRTKKDGKAMGIVTVEYDGDEVEFVVFPREWATSRFMWQERTVGIFSLVKTSRGIHYDRGLRLN